MSEQHDEIASQRALRELRAQWQSTLDVDSAALDAAITARLEQARTHALQPSIRRRSWAAVSAVAAVVLVAALPLSQKLRHDATTVSPVSNVDLDVSELEPWQEDAELLDDLDFYTWLELEAQHAS
jgi:hypothetical protein